MMRIQDGATPKGKKERSQPLPEMKNEGCLSSMMMRKTRCLSSMMMRKKAEKTTSQSILLISLLKVQLLQVQKGKKERTVPHLLLQTLPEMLY
jgi:hypothetical protein